MHKKQACQSLKNRLTTGKKIFDKLSPFRPEARIGTGRKSRSYSFFWAAALDHQKDYFRGQMLVSGIEYN